MNSLSNLICVGISSCLTGQKVRYDGRHKKNDFIYDTLKQHFTLIPFCPEIESGMGIPRRPIQLRLTNRGIRCFEVDNPGNDVTSQILNCADQQHNWLNQLCGYVFKNDSPSCGLKRVNVIQGNELKPVGTGLFAQYVINHYPLLPVEEEHQLDNPLRLEGFIQCVYAMNQWKQLNENT